MEDTRFIELVEKMQELCKAEGYSLAYSVVHVDEHRFAVIGLADTDLREILGLSLQVTQDLKAMALDQQKVMLN